MEITEQHLTVDHFSPPFVEQSFNQEKDCRAGGGIFCLTVRKRTVWCLGMIKSTRGIEKMMEILKQISTAPSPQMDQLETQIYHTFGTSGNLTIGGKTMEQILLQIVEKRGIKQWWGLFQKRLLKDAPVGSYLRGFSKDRNSGVDQGADPIMKIPRRPLNSKIEGGSKKN